jgi:hypothetical protein
MDFVLALQPQPSDGSYRHCESNLFLVNYRTKSFLLFMS